MSNLKIAVVVGSLRKDSINRKLANALISLAPEGSEFQIVEINDLPLYNQDDDAAPSAAAVAFKSAIAAAAGVVFVTPEYNRSIPGVLKNAIDHGSRPYGHSVWGGKPTGVVGASVGALGSALAQQHLRNVLAYLDAPTLGQPELFLQVKEDTFAADGSVGSADTTAFLQRWVDRYAAWVAHQHVS